MKKELPKLTLDDLKETFNWKQPSFSSHTSDLLAILRDGGIDLSITEKQFLLCYAYHVYKLSTALCKDMTLVEFIKEMKKSSLRYYEKEKIFEILQSLDYVDFFNPEESKKVLLELALDI